MKLSTTDTPMPIKQVILFIFILLISTIANAQEGYKISGKIEKPEIVKNSKHYEVWFYTDYQDQVITLENAAITDGYFQLEGKIDFPIPTHLLILDKTNDPVTLGVYEIEFFLENMDYHITFPEKGEAKITSPSKEDQLYQRLNAYNRTCYDSLSNSKYLNSDTCKQKVKEIISRNHAKILQLIQENPKSSAATYSILSYLHILRGNTIHADGIALLGTQGLVIETFLNNSKARYALLDDQAKTSPIGQKLKKYLERVEQTLTAVQRVEVGGIAPDFTLEDPEENSFSLYHIKSKAIIIHFGTARSSHSLKINQELGSLYKEFNTQGLTIISISIDFWEEDEKEWEKTIEENELRPYYHCSYWGSFITQTYNLNKIPTLYLLDKNYNVIAINTQGEALKQKVIELLR